MANGNGTVYLRGKTWTIGFTVNGVRVREGIGPNKRVAEMVLMKRMTEAIENRYFRKRNLGATPFAEFADAYLDRVTSQQKGSRAERIRVLRWVRQLGNRPLGSITRVELESWQREKRQHVLPATVNRDLGRLRHMLNKAVEWDLLADTPLKGLKFLSENNARHRYLTLEQCERLLAACYAPWVRAIVTVALHTGMRLGEILSLKHQDVNTRSGFILIPDSKNGEPRHVPMDSTVSEILSTYPLRPGADLIFSNSKGERLQEIRKAFRNARKRVGLDWLHFHDLRHTFASHWMMNGGDLYVLKDILGHKSIAMTQRYAHLSPEFKKAAVNRMDNMWRRTETAPADVTAAAKTNSPVTPRSQTQALRISNTVGVAKDAGPEVVA